MSDPKLLPRNSATTEERFREVLARPGAVLLVSPDVYDRIQRGETLGLGGPAFLGVPLRVERLLAPGTIAAFHDDRCPLTPTPSGGSDDA